jgi:antitoxin component YwqK of YwqJK toxin-antitoxin module
MLLIKLALLCLLTFVIACKRVQQERYPDGTLSSELSYKGKLLHGSSVWYYPDGKKKFEYNYREGKLEGEAIRWYPNGVMESRGHYKADRRAGKSEYWDEQGHLVKEEFYQEDTLHGIHRIYSPEGVPMVEGYYVKGMYDSVWTYRNQAGLVVGEGEFRNGNGILRSRNPADGIRKETPYSANMKHGDEIWRDGSGQVIKVLRFHEGELLEETAYPPSDK